MMYTVRDLFFLKSMRELGKGKSRKYSPINVKRAEQGNRVSGTEMNWI